MVAENPYEIYIFLHTTNCYSTEGYDMLAGVLANPAAQHVQELRIGVASSGFGAGGAHGIDFRLSFGALPSRDLRLLHITNCTDLAPPPLGVAFPLLADLAPPLLRGACRCRSSFPPPTPTHLILNPNPPQPFDI